MAVYKIPSNNKSNMLLKGLIAYSWKNITGLDVNE